MLRNDIRKVVHAHITDDTFETSKNRPDPAFSRLPVSDRNSLKLGRNLPVKLGSARESIFREIAALRWGRKRVPKYVRSLSIERGEFLEFVDDQRESDSSCQYIVTDREPLEGEIVSALKRLGRPLREDDIPDLTGPRFYRRVRLYRKRVDCIFLKPGYLFELKSSGDTDVGKTGNVTVHDMIGNLICAADPLLRLRLGVFYDNSPADKASRWDSGSHRVLRQIDRSMVLLSDELWRIVLPDDLALAMDHLISNRVARLFPVAA